MTSTEPSRRGRWLRLTALLALVAAVLAAWQTGLLERVTVDSLRQLVAWAGPVAPAAFVAVYALGELLHVPAVVFILAAAVVWPIPVALPLAYLGSLAAAALVFAVARVLVGEELRDAVHRRLPAELRRYDQRLESHGVRTVALIRLLTFMAPTMHWVLATSRVRYRDMLAGTALGVAPGVALLVLLGQRAVERWDETRWWVYGGAVVLGALLVGRRLWRRRSASRVGTDARRAAGAELDPGVPVSGAGSADSTTDPCRGEARREPT